MADNDIQCNYLLSDPENGYDYWYQIGLIKNN